jgi:hypothetical protein
MTGGAAVTINPATGGDDSQVIGVDQQASVANVRGCQARLAPNRASLPGSQNGGSWTG